MCTVRSLSIMISLMCKGPRDKTWMKGCTSRSRRRRCSSSDDHHHPPFESYFDLVASEFFAMPAAILLCSTASTERGVAFTGIKYRTEIYRMPITILLQYVHVTTGEYYNNKYEICGFFTVFLFFFFPFLGSATAMPVPSHTHTLKYRRDNILKRVQ